MTTPESARLTIAVVMTCRNRREKTLACVNSLRMQRMSASNPSLHLYVVDDGSTDGTAEALSNLGLPTTVIHGDGNLFWAAGMAIAERSCMHSDPDYLLWLNDDVVLDDTALDTMLSVCAEFEGAVAVGAFRDPSSGNVTYGGRIRPGRHPLRLVQVPAGPTPQAVDTFNGNCVLIPRSARLRVGPIDGLYSHALADDDYGFRALALGVAMYQAPGTIGQCSRGTLHSRRTLAEAWRYANSPKGPNWASQVRFMRRHGGRLWPLWAVRWRLSSLRQARRGGT